MPDSVTIARIQDAARPHRDAHRLGLLERAVQAYLWENPDDWVSAFDHLLEDARRLAGNIRRRKTWPQD